MDAVVKYIAEAFAKLAKSNSFLMGLQVSAEDRGQMNFIVQEPRRAYQQLCVWASRPIIANPRAYSRFSSRQPSVARSSRQPSLAPFSTGMSAPLPTREAPEDEAEGSENAPKRATQYKRNMLRPNVHIGIH
jgi:hypothetical protein